MESERVELEQALRAATLRGDAEAWRALHARHRDWLRSWLAIRAGDPTVAEEVEQEAWATAVRRMRDFAPGRGPFGAWLRGIAEHHLRGQRRARSRDRHVSDADHAPALDGGPDPAEEVMRREWLSAALGTLSDHHRELLHARYVRQCSIREIAHERGDSEKSVESTLARARAALRHTLERMGVEP